MTRVLWLIYSIAWFSYNLIQERFCRCKVSLDRTSRYGHDREASLKAKAAALAEVASRHLLLLIWGLMVDQKSGVSDEAWTPFTPPFLFSFSLSGSVKCSIT